MEKDINGFSFSIEIDIEGDRDVFQFRDKILVLREKTVKVVKWVARMAQKA